MVLGSADEQVRARWLEGLAGRGDISEASTLAGFSAHLTDAGKGPALLDFSLPDLRGMDGLWLLRRAFPDVQLMVFSGRPNEDEGRKVLATGAAGYCNTYMAPAVLQRAVEVVALGEIWVNRTLVHALVRGRAGDGAADGASGGVNRVNGAAIDTLTRREQAVALRVAQGQSNKEIGRALGITERTVKSHLGAVFRKTGARDRLHLALFLKDRGG
ncbi:MAG: LuxR C-terminal-related transcriptional regulator [Gammaproteobacteria bacterium]